MAIGICTVSGTVLNALDQGVGGVVVKANSNRPFIHPTDGSLIVNYEVSTTTASDGTWSLALIETTTPNLALTISFFYPAGPNSNQRKDYTCIIPNTASATFNSLITGQV